MSDDKCSRKGILVIQSMGIGDLVFAVPVINVLKRCYPNESIAFLTNVKNIGLFNFIPEVEEVFSYQTKTLSSIFRFVRGIRQRNYRLVVVLNPILRGSFVAWLSGAPIRVSYLMDYERKQSIWRLGSLLLTHAYSPINRKMHEVERYLDLLRMFGLPVHDEDKIPRFKINEKPVMPRQLMDRQVGYIHKSPLVIINPCAGWDMKQWSVHNFAVIADWVIRSFGSSVLFIGGGSDRSHIDKIRTKMVEKSLNLAGQNTLIQDVGLLSQCDIFLTNDTGVMHIAAALDVPMVALFGPADLIKFHPLSSYATVLYHKVPCSPCQVLYTSNCRNNVCMQQITIDEVKVAMAQVLRKVHAHVFSEKICNLGLNK